MLRRGRLKGRDSLCAACHSRLYSQVAPLRRPTALGIADGVLRHVDESKTSQPTGSRAISYTSWLSDKHVVRRVRAKVIPSIDAGKQARDLLNIQSDSLGSSNPIGATSRLSADKPIPKLRPAFAEKVVQLPNGSEKPAGPFRLEPSGDKLKYTIRDSSPLDGDNMIVRSKNAPRTLPRKTYAINVKPYVKPLVRYHFKGEENAAEGGESAASKNKKHAFIKMSPDQMRWRGPAELMRQSTSSESGDWDTFKHPNSHYDGPENPSQGVRDSEGSIEATAEPTSRSLGGMASMGAFWSTKPMRKPHSENDKARTISGSGDGWGTFASRRTTESVAKPRQSPPPPPPPVVETQPREENKPKALQNEANTSSASNPDTAALPLFRKLTASGAAAPASSAQENGGDSVQTKERRSLGSAVQQLRGNEFSDGSGSTKARGAFQSRPSAPKLDNAFYQPDKDGSLRKAGPSGPASEKRHTRFNRKTNTWNNEFTREPPPATSPESSNAFQQINSAFSSKPESNQANTWSSLARKPQQAQKSSSEDFWNAFNDAVPAQEQKGSRRQNSKKDIQTEESSSDRGRSASFQQDQSFKKGTTRADAAEQDPEAASNSWPAKEQPKPQKGREKGADRGERTGWKPTRRGGVRRSSMWEGNEERSEDGYVDYVERKRDRDQRKAAREAKRSGPRPILLPELIGINDLAQALSRPPELFLSELAELGFEGVSLDSIMAGDTAALVAQEYNFEPTVQAGESRDLKPRPPPEDPTVLPPRPPVVTIMGHVDHGKTTLLDYLRKSSVAAQEHGGITQHIGAFSVSLSGGKHITFLDTPGHAAFLTMRQRGANVTDIVILVVAADDSVKPQTLEALKHARASRVPIIVAINKVDKDGARIDQVKHDLSINGVDIEDFGGDVQVVCVSGKTGQGMEDLEENILTLSEILDMRAEVDGPAEGWILESGLKPVGRAATILVRRGTMRPGDIIVAGTTYAKIRNLRDAAGVEIAEAPPGTPVEVLGWKDLPVAGDEVIQAPDESRARLAAEYREGLRDREADAKAHEGISEARKQLEAQREREKAEQEKASDGKRQRKDHRGRSDVAVPIEEEGGPHVVNFSVRGDVHGSVEAVCASIQEIGSHEVRPRILRSMAGALTESDVEHATTTGSILVTFNMQTPTHIRRLAEESGVKILEHTVIYHLVDEVKETLSAHLPDDVSVRVNGEAEVLQVFPINVRGRIFKNIAGCRVRNGVITKHSRYRVLRGGEGGEVVFDGKVESLKHGKKDVQEMRKGGECGIGFEEFQDLQVGDQIQVYEEVRTKRTL